MPKIVEVNKKIENAVVEGYKKLEETVVSGYKEVENKFVDAFLKKDGETTDQAKKRLQYEQQERKEHQKNFKLAQEIRIEPKDKLNK